MTKKREDILYMTFRQYISQHLEELKEFSCRLVGIVSHVIIFLVVLFAAWGIVLFLIDSLVKYDFQPIYFFIGTAITLSGFAMIGGIFENKKHSKVEKNLFGLSILFLISAFSFILLIGIFWIIGPEVIDTWQKEYFNYLAMAIFCMGLAFFISGYYCLLITLWHYYYRKIGE